MKLNVLRFLNLLCIIFWTFFTYQNYKYGVSYPSYGWIMALFTMLINHLMYKEFVNNKKNNRST